MFKFVSRIIKYREWIDLDRNQSFFQYLRGIAVNLLHIGSFDNSKAKKFDVITRRYHLEDEQLALQAKSLRAISFSLLVFTFMLMVLGGYYLFIYKLTATGLVFCVSLIPLSLAFRYHFYYTLIIQRRLNCSIKEWFVLTFLKNE